MELVKTDSQMLTPSHPKVVEAVEMARISWGDSLEELTDEKVAMALIHCFVRKVNPFGGESWKATAL